MSFPIIRKSAQPNKWTFSIKPIKNFIWKYYNVTMFSIDPFLGKNFFEVTISNDLNPKIKADKHEKAVIFLKDFPDNKADFIFFDPPYSPRQIKECYNSIGLKPTMEDTQGYNQEKKEAFRILKPGGIVIMCGWNSNRLHQDLKIIDMLIVNHGGNRNDTIVTVQKKVNSNVGDYF